MLLYLYFYVRGLLDEFAPLCLLLSVSSDALYFIR
jgi:hypothetical protein